MKVYSMPKFGLLTNPTLDVLKEIESIANLGFDYVEIGAEWPEGTSQILHAKKDRIRSLLRKRKLFAICHTAWWIDLSSQHEGVRRAWIEESKSKILVARELGIKSINFHTHAEGFNTFHKRYQPEILDTFVSSMRELSRFAKKHGVGIILENAADRGEIVSFKDYKYIASKLPGVKVHLDVGHAFVNGGMKSISDFIGTFGNRIEHLHFHDNHGQNDEHLPIGRGKIDYEKVVGMLKSIGYDKTITFEVFTSKRDAVNSREKIRELWGKI
jgi:sugar phosphate isomerase/epimerase